MKISCKKLNFMLITVLSVFAISGFFIQKPSSLMAGLKDIQMHHGRLISDFTVVGGVGSALINASLVGFIGLILLYLNNVSISGPTAAAVLTMTGFGLFGKTPLNIMPIIFGVFLLCRLIRKPFKTYIIIALFGTALGPMVSFLAFETVLFNQAAIPSLLSIAFAGIIGTIIGMLLPPIAITMLKFHQGYNLYNLGLSCGFLGLFSAAVLKASGSDMALDLIWNKNCDKSISLLLIFISIAFMIAGIISERSKLLSGLKTLFRESGRLPTDFLDYAPEGAVLFNMGLVSMMSWMYINFTGGNFNGPTMGGALTVAGFGAFGKHPKNIIAPMAGVLLGCLLFGMSPASPGPLLAGLFVTTLAPLAGEFGILLGISSGFLHLALVMQTASWHGGVDLYNNGFSGGLTATFFVAVIEWYRTHKDDIRGKHDKAFEHD